MTLVNEMFCFFFSEKLKTLKTTVEEMASENASYHKQIKELEEELIELKSQYSQLVNNHDKTVSENAETIRSLKVMFMNFQS